jgi:dimethylaniline monooxygenase (N-oxide forming)
MTARVCIIGAGSSGITAAQVLHARGVDFDCFEVGSEVGGNWRYGNDNQMSSAYESLHINTSRQLMEYAAYPMPEELPDYPSHRQIAAYFDDFVDHFGLRELITFRTEVVKVQPVPAGGYDVTVRGVASGSTTGSGAAETRHYEHVIVANGHHWNPRWPEPGFPGAESFPGEQIHAHHYRTPESLVGKRVLVLGIGNSACDIAVESSRVATSTDLAMRRGAHIIPKYLLGVPTDRLTDSPLARGPLKIQQWTMAALLRLTQGKVTDYGLPEPDHAVLHAHPTVSQDLLNRLGHGDITIRPNIDRFEGSKVFFTDGTAAEYDVVVYCTGYRVSFPFLDDAVVSAEDNHLPLYRRVVDPDHPGLYFLGLIQPLGAIMPLAEAQAGWVADLVTGVGRLPSASEMRREIASYDDNLRKRFVASKRHTIEVDFHAYRADIEKERKRASRR